MAVGRRAIGEGVPLGLAVCADPALAGEFTSWKTQVSEVWPKVSVTDVRLDGARGDTVRLRARRDAIHLFNSEGLALRAMQGTGHLA